MEGGWEQQLDELIGNISLAYSSDWASGVPQPRSKKYIPSQNHDWKTFLK